MDKSVALLPHDMAQIHNVEHLDSHTVVVDSHTDLVQDIHIESVADNPDIE